MYSAKPQTKSERLWEVYEQENGILPSMRNLLKMWNELYRLLFKPRIIQPKIVFIVL